MISFFLANWQQIKPFNQTYVLIAVLSLSYVIFIFSLGFHPLALIVGLAIALLTLVIWSVIIPAKITRFNAQNQADLLIPKNFENELARCDRLLGKDRVFSQWQATLSLVKEIHVLAQDIHQSDRILLPELLEILHFVLHLCREIANSLVALKKVKTSASSQQITQHLQLKQSQLQEIYQTLSQLKDKLLIADLEVNSTATTNSLKQLLESINIDCENS
ncbi:hypothetical protein STA3757_49370 (plasmid) [Stanieria sp. NIES-3757]|nr:hypothetical protein STA3757_49370 [Stanieria sp. NIES-3757]